MVSTIPVSPEPRQPSTEDPVLAAVMRRLAAGDAAAAAELYDSTCQLVFGLALRILGERSAAEDIVIEVYAQAWSLAGSFNPERGTPAGWLLTLTRSRAIDAVRARRREGVPLTLDVVENRACERPGPEEASLEAERRRAVSRALSGLSPEQRDAIQLAYFSGLSHTQIASQLDQPLGTVKTRIRQGMIQLRQLLGHLAPASANRGTA